MEGVAIVVSILLAFGIQAWWDNHQERDTEQRILLALKAEIRKNLVELESQVQFREATKESITRLFKVGAGQEANDPDTADKLIGNLLWWGQIDFSTGALESVLQGGFLSIIRNDQLREALAGMPAEYKKVTDTVTQDYETLNNDLWPYLYQRALIPQIANTIGGQPGTGENFWSYTTPVGEVMDHSNIVTDPQFLSILTKTNFDQNDAIWTSNLLSESLQRTVDLIDEQLVIVE